VRVPAGPAEGEIREKGSVFRAVVLPVPEGAGERGALEAIAALERRFRDATHVCWALRAGEPPRERSSDAGEPHGTAGVPILRVLQGAELGDVCAAVARWYGGVKLGKGGLARAYAEAVRTALAGLEVALRTPVVDLPVTVAYERLGAVQRLVHPPEVELAAAEYDGERARLVLRVHAERRAALEEALAAIGVRRSE
jgi:uncharacterized YigZ family protein